MPSAKSGSAGTIVAPAEPTAAEQADVADPGVVEKLKAEQRQQQKGKYGAVKTEPFKPAQSEAEKEKKTSWIEIKLLDADGQPVPGEAYKIQLPDGSECTGTLDENGFARVEGIEPGSCKVTFPNLDQSVWGESQ